MEDQQASAHRDDQQTLAHRDDQQTLVHGDEQQTLVHGDAARDTRRLALVMHVAFFVLLASSLTRYLIRHPSDPATQWVIALATGLALMYVLGPILGPKDSPTAPVTYTAGVSHKVWLGAVMAIWVTLVIVAPSFGWCAVPLFYTGLRTLRTGAAILLVAVITAFVMAAQLKLRVGVGFDPNMLFAPPAVAAVATAVFIHSQRQAARLQTVITDLVRTRRELAATERREGTLAERQRLSMEIHDSLAQGLSSQQMLLQAADRVWDTDQAAARRHIRTAESFAEHNLAEARRFVHDLAPADLAGGSGLDQALAALAERESRSGLVVRCRVDGTPAPLPDRVQSALLRIAQGALANVTEHADARTAVLTLVYFDDQVVLDVADDGRGFDPAAGPLPSGVRGHGLPAIRARVAQLGGSLTIESAPGDGTVLSAAIPLESPS